MYETTPKSQTRFKCLDIARGITIMMMIMIDNQGSIHDSSKVFYLFRESEWNGFSPADCVFPSFLFIMGVTTLITLSKKKYQYSKKSLIYTVLLRFIKIFLVGMFLNFWASSFNIFHFRILGVLQRIGICYLIISLLYLLTPFMLRWFILTLFILLYSIPLYYIPVPLCNNTFSVYINPNCNMFEYIDNIIFMSHNRRFYTQPEGLMSTFSALITVACGLEYGYLYILSLKKGDSSSTTPFMIFKWWSIQSVFWVLSGSLLSLTIPLNKKIWSLSFALLSAGVSSTLLLISYLLVDFSTSKIDKLSTPLNSDYTILSHVPPSFNEEYSINTQKTNSLWYSFFQYLQNFLTTWLEGLGRNAIIIFILMISWEIFLLDSCKITLSEDSKISLWSYLNSSIFPNPTQFTSSVFAFFHLLLFSSISAILHYKKWYYTL